MGSPISAVVANLYMDFFKELVLRSAPAKPQLWKRYVDDTCSIVKKGTVEGLLDHLNSVRPSIRFTVEVTKDGGLPFLDTLLQRREDGGLDVTVYRKPTHTPTDAWSSDHTIHPMSRGDWSSASMIEQGASPPGRTTCRRKSATSPSPEAERLPQSVHSLFISAFYS